MRIVHDRKCREMKRLDERGAEAQKLDSTLATIRKLSTKMRIAIQVVDSISNKISKLRDDELWPQISELIQGLMRMWSVMLECHRTQCRALSEAKNLDSLVSGGKISDAHVEVTKQLELELLEWIASFSTWIYAQKSYVKALNGWLIKGLRYVPEVTPDGIAPFSPGRLGAPPVFVICNQWAQTVERISENEVIDAMRAFASNVLQLWEKHNFEQRQMLMANKDMERTLRIMEREEQEMRKTVENQNKKLVVVSGQSILTVSEHTEAGSMQSNLRQIFEAMENFSASTLKAYEELHIRAEEERSARENEKVT